MRWKTASTSVQLNKTRNALIPGADTGFAKGSGPWQARGARAYNSNSNSADNL